MEISKIQEKQRSTKKRLGILLVLLIGLMLIGGTYAFFTAVFTGVEEDTTISIGGGRLGIHMDGGNIITMNNIYPRAEAWETKRFTITGNNSTPLEMEYFLNLVVTENTFQNGSLTYTLESQNTSNTGTPMSSIIEQRGIPTGAGVHPLGQGVFNQPGNDMVHTYYLTFYFPSRGVPQNEDQGRTFRAHVGISGEPTVNASNMMVAHEWAEPCLWWDDECWENLEDPCEWDDYECWDKIDQDPGFLRGPLRREEIQNITFVNTNIVPTDAVASWDVSVAQNGSVMAWHTAPRSTQQCEWWEWDWDEETDEEIITCGEYINVLLHDVYIGSLGGVLANYNSDMLFSGIQFLESLDARFLDTREVVTMSSLLSSSGMNVNDFNLDLRGWQFNNIQEVSDILSSTGFMSQNCSMNLSGWDIPSLINMMVNNWFDGNIEEEDMLMHSLLQSVVGLRHGMSSSGWFCGMESNTIDLSNWDVSNIRNMSYAFMSSGSMWSFLSRESTLILNNWNTSNVTDMSYMFAYSPWTSIQGLNTWNVSNVRNMSGMFTYTGIGSGSFTTDLSNWNVSNVTDMSMMFAYTGVHWGSGGFTGTFNVGNLNNWNTSNVTNMSHMFHHIGRTSMLDLRNWNTSNVTDMSGMFGYAGVNWNIADEYYDIDIHNALDFEAINEMLNDNIEGTINLPEEVIEDINELIESAEENIQELELTTETESNTTAIPGNMIIRVDNWNTSNVTDMSGMFAGAGFGLLNFIIDGLETWDVSNVSSMNGMFEEAGSHTSDFGLDLRNWRLLSIEDMSHMFDSVGSRSSSVTLDLRGWEIPNLNNIYNNQMFSEINTNLRIYVSNNIIQNWLLNETDNTDLPSSTEIIVN